MRNRKFDVIRGILIISVVLGHFRSNILSYVLYLFHMPLFFMLSGIFLKKEKVTDKEWFMKRVKGLIIPYICYGLFDCLICRQSIYSVLKLVWGGRYITGVYWYTTCFLFALGLFAFLLIHFSDRKCKCLIFVSGLVAVVESNLISGSLGEAIIANNRCAAAFIKLLIFPGIPWDMDVALITIVYIAIGFYNKERIKHWMNSNSRKYDIIALIIGLNLMVFIYFNYQKTPPIYSFDMKPVYYHELSAALIIPCAFGFVLLRITNLLEKILFFKHINNYLAFLGHITIPIMFLHIPLNHLIQPFIRNSLIGIVVYMIVGIGIPILITVYFCKYKRLRTILGLPQLN